MIQRRVIAGTRNSAKVKELAAALRGVAQLEAPPAGLAPPAEETGPSIEAIAAAKAIAWSRALVERDPGAIVVASDGGLLIPALGERWDPVRTRRFAGAGADDRVRADALLGLTASLHGDDRQIGWREALALARDGKLLATFTAESPAGLLALDYDPALITAGGGFWIPALWICPEFGGKRLAELTPDERSRRNDHWTTLGQSVREFLTTLES